MSVKVLCRVCGRKLDSLTSVRSDAGGRRQRGSGLHLVDGTRDRPVTTVRVVDGTPTVVTYSGRPEGRAKSGPVGVPGVGLVYRCGCGRTVPVAEALRGRLGAAGCTAIEV